MPLGPRRSSRDSSREHVSVQTISKSEVDRILFHEKHECQVKLDSDNQVIQYSGCLNNLYMILHNGTTRVKVAGSRTPGYRDGYKTVVMKAPCVSATFYIRRKL